MKKYATLKTMMVMVLVLIMGTAGSALAYRGWSGQGQGGYGCSGDGYAWKRGGGTGQGDFRHPGGGYGPMGGGAQGYGQGMTNMSREDYEKMEQLRQTFFKDTEILRSGLRSKAFELKSEFAKETPDVNTLKNLQKELSVLEAELDQKRIEHRLEMKKVNPAAGEGFRMGYGPKGGRSGNGCGRR